MIAISTKAKRAFNALLTFSLVLFSFFYFRSLLSDPEFSWDRISYSGSIISAILFVLAYGLFSLNWYLSCMLFTENPSNQQPLVFLASQPYKYLPTSLFVLSSRAVFSKKLGISYKDSTKAQLVENICIFGSNLYLFAVAFLAGRSLTATLVTVIVGVLAMFLLRRHKQLSFSFKNKKISLQTDILIRMFMLCFIAWLVTGFAFVLLNSSLGFNGSIFDLIAANTIAFSLGMFAVFAPGGIGVREVIYTAFTVNPTVIIFWRLTVFMADFFVGIPSYFVIRRLSRLQENEPKI